MGFFKDFKKAYKAASKVANSGSSRSKSAPKRSSGSTKSAPVKKQVIPSITRSNAPLPDVIATNQSGLTLTPTKNTHRYDIPIVGESYRQQSIKEVVKLFGTGDFPIYLVRDPNNQHDKYAVGVWAAGLQVGFIQNPECKAFSKRVDDATAKGELIWGWGRASSRSGDVYGVFGHVFIDKFIAPDETTIKPKQLKPEALAKAIQTFCDLEEADYPETTAQAKSLAKKAVKAAIPLYAHSLWVEESGAPEAEWALWETVRDECSSLFDDAEEHAFLTEADDMSIDMNISSVADTLKPLQGHTT